MKKILLSLTALLLIPLSVFSISLSELQNDSDNYTLVSENEIFLTFVAQNTVASIRYSPPYYVLSADVYIVDYSSNTISNGNCIISYNYDNTSKEVIKNLRKKFPQMPKETILQKALTRLKENTGMVGSLSEYTVWTLDGSYIGVVPANTMALLNIGRFDNIGPDSGPYHIGNFVFYKYYGEYFQPKISSKSLY